MKEHATGESLIGVNIIHVSGKWGTQTNNYGFFSLKIPRGNQELLFSYPGFKTLKFNTSEISSNTSIQIQLLPLEAMKELVIEGSVANTEIGINKVSVPLHKITEIPSFMGESDLMKFLTVMPGVSKGNESNQGMFVRGGTPDQNLVMVDDATIYSSFHLFGINSLFNGSELKKAELNKGGFSAKYGGRTASVLNLSLKDGNRERWSGEAGIGLLSSHVQLNGPIVKDRSSVLLSFRRTYIDLLTKPFMEPDNEVGYSYFDLHGKVNVDLGPKDRIYLSMYTGKDNFGAITTTDKTKLRWGNDAYSFRWNHVWSRNVFMNTTAFFTGYQSSISFQGSGTSGQSEYSFFTGINDIGLKLDVDYMVHSNHWIKTGISIVDHKFTPSLNKIEDLGINSVEVRNKSVLQGMESVIYVEDQFKITQKLKSVLGLRLSSFKGNAASYIVPEPRLFLEYTPNKSLVCNFSYTHMSQFMNLISTGMMGLPSEIWIPVSANLKPQIARQLSSGYAVKLPFNLFWGQEFFYKHHNQFTAYKEGVGLFSMFFSQEQANLSAKYFERLLTQGQMESYGTETSLRFETRKFESWFNYTLSKTRQQFNDVNQGQWFNAGHDRRHDISWVFIYRPNNKWTCSASWVYGSAFNLTIPKSQYEAKAHSPVDMNGMPIGFENVFPANSFDQKNSFRTAAFHHLDLSANYTIVKKKHKQILGFNIYNVYNRMNPFYYSITYDEQSKKNVLIQNSLFPIIPSMNYKYVF
ncbi:MAG: TonB-dependent receptor [Bacteroidota bacterium]|nr:TonB-dependent receptor [Bacteroidota bacterium]